MITYSYYGIDESLSFFDLMETFSRHFSIQSFDGGLIKFYYSDTFVCQIHFGYGSVSKRIFYNSKVKYVV